MLDKIRNRLKKCIKMFRNYYTFKKFLPFLSKNKFYPVVALGKEGYCSYLKQAQAFVGERPQQEKLTAKLGFSPFRMFLTLTGAAKKFNGDFILETTGGDVKIFSFRERLVLNFVAEKQKYDHLKNTYCYFSQFFQIPYIESDDMVQCFTEELINHVPFDELSEDELRLLLKALIFSTEKHIDHLDKKNCKKLDISNHVENFKKHFEKYESPIINKLILVSLDAVDVEKRVPLIPCHGDAKKNNILLRGEDVFFIDWEYAKDYVFYYDLFYMLTERCIYQSEEKGSINPFTKENMKALQQVFSLFGIDLKGQNLPYYLALALMQRLVQIKESGNCNMSIELECYERFWASFQFTNIEN